MQAVRIITALCLVAALGSLAPCAIAQPRFDFDSAPGRLSKDIRPERYALTLDVDPAADVFSGTVQIALKVRQAASAFVVHAHQLEAKSVVLDSGPGERLLNVEADAASQTWRLVPADGQPVAAGAHRLSIAYGGHVQTADSGLYVVPYTAAGRPERMLATQLEAIFARMLFPCFDEPAYRAVFEIAVRAPRGLEVLSNMPLASTTGQGEQALHRFAPTPPMPTYLVAVAVGRFDALAGSAGPVPLRILTAPGKREQAAWALASTERILPYYGDYFGLPYALPKLDQLAVPSGRTGAMEDWGLISYAESTLLDDPARSGPRNRRNVFGLIAHEVAHQWFGNLVTAASWEEIWLNEAFATWMADKATAHMNPAWQTDLRRRGNTDRAMARDATTATRAIRSGAVREDGVFNVFDDITYTKGGAVLDMVEQWLSPERFQRGLQAYMRARRFSNATAGDLWFHMGQAGASDVAAVAASWTDQRGFPLVSVSASCGAGRTDIQLSQKRFTTDPALAGDATLWKIPLVLRHGDETRAVLLESRSQAITLPGCPVLPTLVNPGGKGYYRVVYAPPQRAALAQQFAGLPPAARITLLSDTFALAQSGALPMSDYIGLLAALPQTTGPGRTVLFEMARSGLRFLDSALAGTPAQTPLRAAARALLAPELAALGWQAKPGEDPELALERSALVGMLADFDDADVLDRARVLFDADQAGVQPLAAGLRSAVTRAAARRADAPRVARLVTQLQTTANEADRLLYAQALAGVMDPALAEQVLALSLQDTLAPTIAVQLPGWMGLQQVNGTLAYRFTLEHWPALRQRAEPIFQATAWLLPDAAQSFNDAARASQLRDDQARLFGGPGAAAAARAAARIELLAAVKQREADRLAAPLKALADGMR